MAQDTLARTVGKLEERVKNHITFFWSVAAFQFLCLGGLLWLSLQTRTTVNGIAKVEANAPAQIVASLLNSPVTTSSEAQANLAAAASVLQSAKIGKIKPDSAKLKAISDKLIDDQNQYPELPQVWATTGIFINYKFQALLPSAAEIAAKSGGKVCGTQVKIPGTIRFENCELNLEDVAARFINVKENGQHVPIQFINCVVRYSGGALPDAPMEFQNSVLTFRITVVPSRKAINAMRQFAQTETVDRITIQG
jgi:hypothetical protein